MSEKSPFQRERVCESSEGVVILIERGVDLRAGPVTLKTVTSLNKEARLLKIHFS